MRSEETSTCNTSKLDPPSRAAGNTPVPSRLSRFGQAPGLMSIQAMFSHSSGTLLALQSVLVPAAMSHSSGMPLVLQSGDVAAILKTLSLNCPVR